MPIVFTCFRCEKSYQAEDDQVGQTFPCTSCRATLVVPGTQTRVSSSRRSSRVAAAEEPVFEFDGEETAPAPGFEAEETAPVPGRGALYLLLAFLFFLGMGTAGVFLAIVLTGSQDQAVVPPPKGPGEESGEARPPEVPPIPPAEKSERPPILPDKSGSPAEKPPPEKPPEVLPGALPAPSSLSDVPWTGHTAPVHTLALAADGKLLYSAAGGTEKKEGRPVLIADNSLRAWGLPEGKEVRRLEGLPDGVGAAAFSPDGKLAAVAPAAVLRAGAVVPGGDGSITLWDLESRKPVRPLKGHTKEVFCLAFTADGRKLLSGGADFVLRVWDVASGKSLFALPGHSNAINQVVVSPDGRTALTGSSDFTARLWDIEEGKPLRTLAEHRDIIWAVAFAPDGRLALTGGGMQHVPGVGFTAGARDHDIRIWDVEVGRERKRLSGHAEAVGALAFSPDGQRVLSAGNDGKVLLWQVDTGKPVKEFTGHTGLVRGVVFFPDGRRAASGGDDRRLRIWDLPGTITDLAKDLRSSDAGVRTTALLELGRMGEGARPALPALLEALTSGDRAFRNRALVVVKGLRPLPRGSFAQVEALLKDPTFPEGRLFALEVIEGWGADARGSIKVLLGLLDERDAALRRKVVTVLGKFGPEARDDLFRPLGKALTDEDGDVRAAALAALEKVGASRDEVPLLREWLGSKATPVRVFACKALADLKVTEAADDLLEMVVREKDKELRVLALAGLAKLAPTKQETRAACVRALTDTEPDVRLQAVRTLGSLPAEADALPALLRAADHEDGAVRKVAIEAAGRAKLDRSHVPLLATLLGSKKQEVRQHALELVGKLGRQADEVVPELCVVLRSSEGEERKKVLATLKKLGPAAKKAGPDLAKLLEDKDLRLTVIELMAQTQAPEIEQAVPSLIASLRAESVEDLDNEQKAGEREQARKLLVQAGKQAVPGLIRALENTFAGGNLRTPEGVTRAAARLEVIRVAAELDGKSKTNYLLVVLARLAKEDPHPAVKRAAAEARSKLLSKE